MDWFDQNLYLNSGKVLSKNNDYFIFGFKDYFIKCDILLEVGFKIQSFCEQNDESCYDIEEDFKIPVIPLEMFLRYDKSIYIIIISDINTELANHLTEFGFNNVISLDPKFLIQFRTNNMGVMAAKERIEELLNVFTDEDSKRIFKNLVNARLTLNIKYLQMSFNANQKFQYFDDDIIKLSQNEIFVDGGSFCGETTLLFIAKVKGKFDTIYLFEPLEGAYNHFKDVCRFLNDDRLITINKGLYSSKCELNFSNRPNGSSCIQADGMHTIKVDCLDNIADEITFLKLDVEGAEKEALIGAKNLIIKSRPKLAVCLYHKFDDLWDLPLFIKSLNPSYNIFMRHYSNDFHYHSEGVTVLDSICYAI